MTSIGSRLKKLRIENGYSQRQLAEYLEIDQSNLSKIENDKRKLNWALSDKLLSLYNSTPEYLLGETDYYKKPNISFRSGMDIDLNCISKINKLSYHLNVLRELDGDKTPIKLPKPSINLKRKWGIDDYSPIDVFTVIPQMIPNLTIVWFPMKRSLSACSFKNEIDSIILLNSSHSKAIQNFSLAHELYHLLNVNERNEGPGNQIYNDLLISFFDSEHDIEKKADDFAFNFLMSERALYDFMERNDIEVWSIEDIINCGQYFHLDHNIFIRRLFSSDLIDANQLADFSIEIFDKASMLGYDTSLYEESYENKKYFSIGEMIPLTNRLYNEDKISQSRRKEILLELFRQDIVY